MQPQSPDPQFDFMLKNQPQAKRTLGLPAMTKPLKFGLAIVSGLILIIILGSVLGKPKTSTTNISGVLARGSEIQRVTAEVQQLSLQDPATQALSATVNTTLASDQSQLEQYLANNHTKVSESQLAADTDKSTDTQMQTASQNNNLDQTYITYLQQSLAKYRYDIQTAYNAAGPKGRAILKDSLDGLNTLLSNSPLKP